MALPQLDIQRLSPEERIRLAAELWDSLLETPEEVPLTQAQTEALDRLLAAYREDRDPGEPWRGALGRMGKLSAPESAWWRAGRGPWPTPSSWPSAERFADRRRGA